MSRARPAHLGASPNACLALVEVLVKFAALVSGHALRRRTSSGSRVGDSAEGLAGKQLEILDAYKGLSCVMFRYACLGVRSEMTSAHDRPSDPIAGLGQEPRGFACGKWSHARMGGLGELLGRLGEMPVVPPFDRSLCCDFVRGCVKTVGTQRPRERRRSRRLLSG